MCKPILKFKETKTHYGIMLTGSINIEYASTIPSYKGNSAPFRKQTEQFIEAQITRSWLRLRGLDELSAVVIQLEQDVILQDKLPSVLPILNNLLKELLYPQFEKVGNTN